jgi:hypothetical protein
MTAPALERHHSLREAAALWGVSRQTMVRLLDGQPGVLEYGHDDDGKRRPHKTRLIPESVLLRLHSQLCTKIGRTSGPISPFGRLGKRGTEKIRKTCLG